MVEVAEMENFREEVEVATIIRGGQGGNESDECSPIVDNQGGLGGVGLGESYYFNKVECHSLLKIAGTESFSVVEVGPVYGLAEWTAPPEPMEADWWLSSLIPLTGTIGGSGPMVASVTDTTERSRRWWGCRWWNHS